MENLNKNLHKDKKSKKAQKNQKNKEKSPKNWATPFSESLDRVALAEGQSDQERERWAAILKEAGGEGQSKQPPSKTSD